MLDTANSSEQLSVATPFHNLHNGVIAARTPEGVKLSEEFSLASQTKKKKKKKKRSV